MSHSRPKNYSKKPRHGRLFSKQNGKFSHKLLHLLHTQKIKLTNSFIELNYKYQPQPLLLIIYTFTTPPTFTIMYIFNSDQMFHTSPQSYDIQFLYYCVKYYNLINKLRYIFVRRRLFDPRNMDQILKCILLINIYDIN